MVIRYPNGKLYENAPKVEKNKESAKFQSSAKEKIKEPSITVTVEKA